MQVKLLRSWRGHPEGSIRTWQDGFANVLISRNICEEVKPVERAAGKKHGNKSGNIKRV